MIGVARHFKFTLYHIKPTLNVTGFAKRGVPHTSNLQTLTIHNSKLEKVIDSKFGQS